ncbi:MAG: Uma2 family endonuclease [Candidatus Rokubacteria bacterium]|nr:Uma2 family endonuclease [Candidatus Rokubacteria bacterium]
MAIEAERPRRLFTVDEYHRMADAGVFGPDERVELIEGEIIQMSPIGPRHAGCVINLTRMLITRLADRAVVSPQGNPVVIRPRSEPQPDALVLRSRAVSYSRAHPTPDDVLLAVEVSDTTTRFDRIVKARLYARAGIAEYWLVDVGTECIDVFRSPTGEAYAETTRAGRGAVVAPLAFPEVTLAVDDLFA